MSDTGAPERAHDWAEANRQFFDNMAREDKPHPHERYAQSIVQGLKENLPLSSESTTVLDYACGQGMIAHRLFPAVKKIVGVDISQASVYSFNERAKNQGFLAEDAQAFCINLEGKEGELGGKKFDVVTCTMAYHHLEDLQAVTRTLAYFLKPGGILAVIDLVKPLTGNPSPFQGRADVHHVVPHKAGFSAEDMKALFVETAGLQSFKYLPFLEVKVDEGPAKSCFIALGYKVEDAGLQDK